MADSQQASADPTEDFKHDEKRIKKPTLKVIENRIQQDRAKLEVDWNNLKIAIGKLKKTIDSVEQIRAAINDVRSVFADYENTHQSLADFIASANAKECQDESTVIVELMKNRKEFVMSAINDAMARKIDLLQELRSNQSYASSHTSSTSAIRARAKADAAAALKRAEMHIRRVQMEYQSEKRLGEEEEKLRAQQAALARITKDEETRLQNLLFEEEVEVAQARLAAVEEEIYFKEDVSFIPLQLPEIDSKERVISYLSAQQGEKNPEAIQVPPSNESHRVFLSNEPQDNHLSERKTMESYVQFMARREIIANKVEKFNDCPENFRTWKASFQNMIKDINITASEELSLIVEYTTGQSKKLIQRLRNAYIESPDEGVKESWKKLCERFGSDAVITKVHLSKLNAFPKIAGKDNKRLQEFGDLMLELECAKKAGGFKGLKILDEPVYIRPIIEKLPDDLLNRWQRHAHRYKANNAVVYPPFSELAEFIQEIALERNDPYLTLERAEKETVRQSKPAYKPNYAPRVTALRTDVSDHSPRKENPPPIPEEPKRWCFIHKCPHPLTKCRVFREKSLEERRNLLKQERVCMRCATTRSHTSKDCKEPIHCNECQNEGHITALHPGPPVTRFSYQSQRRNGEEPNNTQNQEPSHVTATCTGVCHNLKGARSCCKICPAYVYHASHPENKIKVYALIDDQSNHSLAKAKLFDALGVEGEATSYILKTCTGVSSTKGRRARGLVIESLDGTKIHNLPMITECDAIPDSKDEIPTPEVASAYAHLHSIANKIPELDADAEVLMLIGRDVPPLHKIYESKNGPRNAPWGQRLDLGWVVIGNTCLDGAHEPEDISTCTTNILHNGRPSHLQPCPNRFHLKHSFGPDSAVKSSQKKRNFINGSFVDELGTNVFETTKDDNKIGTSVEDRRFIDIMDQGMAKNSAGNWVAPLPFREEIVRLPNTRELAIRRLKTTLRNLDRKPEMKEHYFAFMQKLLDNSHAEVVPHTEIATYKPCWYLPHFGVYHPQKPNKVRVVYDAAAECCGISLNSLLLSGPDLTNSLLGILLRFRENPIAFMADVEQMFYSFVVQENHRDFLRFLWYQDNHPDGEIVEYRMKVHIFGNTSSPAVATFGLRKTAEVEGAKFGADAADLVNRNFYVDDALKSMPTAKEAIDLLRRTQSMLATAKLRLHKIASNCSEVMEAFPGQDQASDLRNLDLSKDIVPVQRSLGVSWDLKDDTFTFKASLEK